MYEILYDNPNEDLITRLLKIRNIDDKEKFIRKKLKEYWISPSLLSDIDIAVERIIYAISNNEKICVFGDYDVDGVIGSFILYDFFINFLNYKNIFVYFPNRYKDGYGLNDKHIEVLKEKGVKLLITVDNGIKSIEACDLAIKYGIDVIITDHHLPSELPKALAIINPHISEYYFKGLSGAGVVFKLLSYILNVLNFGIDFKKKFLSWYLPFVGLTILTDNMPLINENRVFLHYGLKFLNIRKGHPNFLKLLDYLKIKKVDTYHLSFLIGPRLNATGRLASVEKSFNFLVTGDFKDFLEIEDINNKRKDLTSLFFQKYKDKNFDNIVLIYDEEIPEGLLGLLASKFSEYYKKITGVFTYSKEKDLVVGSLRSYGGYDVYSLVSDVDIYLEKYGGHKQAAGISFKKEYLNIIFEILNEKLKNYEYNDKIYIDTILYENDVNNIKNLSKLAPFGYSNPNPLLYIKNFKIINKKQIKGGYKYFLDIGNVILEVFNRGHDDNIKDLIIEYKIEKIGSFFEVKNNLISENKGI